MNVGSTPTFARGAGSIVDITAASDSLASRVVNWRVLESVFNFSDHHYIRFSLMRNPAGITASCPQVPSGRDTSGGIDSDTLLTGLLLAEWLDGGTRLDEQDADSGAVSFRSRVTAACNFNLPKRRAPKPGKPPVDWWTAEIDSLRSECVRAKRRKVRMVTRITRLRQRGDADVDNECASVELTRTNDAFREAKKQLKSAILKSKKACWTELISSVDSDPFGKPYKLVMRKLRGPPASVTMERHTLDAVIDTLFPTYRNSIGSPLLHADSPVPFTAAELEAAMCRIRSKSKAPGPDGITTKILSAVHKADPHILLGLFNKCLRDGTFPLEWKTSRVVLLKKGNKPEGVPSSYQPLYLLNDVGKVLESLLSQRLEDHITRKGGLSPNQYGFRKKLSTDDAVLDLHNTIVQEVNDGKFCLAIGIDIKNAFNSIQWPDILTALERWAVPAHLHRMFHSYFSGRSGTLQTCSSLGGSMDVNISGGVPQGSVVGPLLWNVTYDPVLREEVPQGAKLLGFADDTLIMTSSNTITELESIANVTINRGESPISAYR